MNSVLLYLDASRWNGRAAIATGDQLGKNADRNFRHRLRTDVETERSVCFFERRRRNTTGQQIFVDELYFAFAADHADIAGLRRCQVVQSFLIMGVSTRDD